jgi:hypothetical protein
MSDGKQVDRFEQYLLKQIADCTHEDDADFGAACDLILQEYRKLKPQSVNEPETSVRLSVFAWHKLLTELQFAANCASGILGHDQVAAGKLHDMVSHQLNKS